MCRLMLFVYFDNPFSSVRTVLIDENNVEILNVL